jgi:hypothetical protein
MHPNYADTRHLFLTNTLAALAQHHTPEELKAAEPLIQEHIATTYTDEVLFQDFNRMAADKRAKEAAYWNEYYAADAAKKAAAKLKQVNEDKLADANKVAMTYLERAEEAEDRNESLEDQLSALMRQQGR